jgi:hypothetical protein
MKIVGGDGLAIRGLARKAHDQGEQGKHHDHPLLGDLRSRYIALKLRRTAGNRIGWDGKPLSPSAVSKCPISGPRSREGSHAWPEIGAAGSG